MKVGDLIKVMPDGSAYYEYDAQLGVIIAYARIDRWGAASAVDVMLMDGTKECFKTLRLEVVNESG